MSVHSPRPLASSRTRSKKNLPRCSFPSTVPPLTPDHRVMSHHSINRTSHSISIHNAVSATPKAVPGATRAFASSGTPADCTMLGISVLYRAKRFDYIVSGVNRGDNLGLHVVYSGTVAGAREGAMRTGAVGVAVSLDSYSRSADYSEAVSLFSIFVRAIRLTTAAVCVLFVNRLGSPPSWSPPFTTRRGSPIPYAASSSTSTSRTYQRMQSEASS